MFAIHYLPCIVIFLILLHLWLCRKPYKKDVTTKVIKGKVTIMKKRLMDLTDLRTSIVDRIYEFFARRISLQLVSATVGDPRDMHRGKIGERAYLEGWITKITSIHAEHVEYDVTFYWEESFGTPGAIIVKNNHHYEFKLFNLTLEKFPGKGDIHFICNSWVYPAHVYSSDRIFFANDIYLPSKTPPPLKLYRENELNFIRGDGTFRRYQKHERMYDYDIYNDLGDERPVLGGSAETPYPRRCRTARPQVKGTDEYLPRDEYFRHVKSSEFEAYKVKSGIKIWLLSQGEKEFHSFQDVQKLYGYIHKPEEAIAEIAEWIPLEFIKELFRTDGEPLFKFSFPKVVDEKNGIPSWVKEPEFGKGIQQAGWRTDKEFAREMLAGLNPVFIRAATEGDLDEFLKIPHERVLGEIPEHIKQVMHQVGKQKLEGIETYFILDHTKDLPKFFNKIPNKFIYASKTFLHLEADGTLTPYGIILEGQNSQKRLFHPAEAGPKGLLWMLAKAHVTVIDSGFHQLISHWLNTHAVIEPFAIATHRQLSVIHPIHQLLIPHFHDTMNINNFARAALINADGIIESTFFPGSFSMELTSKVYKDWNFMDHALPTDLLNRDLVKEDKKYLCSMDSITTGLVKENNERLEADDLIITDYPYAVDGLDIWYAIKEWVTDYCTNYYHDDASIQADTELQQWWKEIREVGHGDLKDKPWWPKMQTRTELIHSCTIIIWLASAFHAAVNFGQYAYAGYVPNRPTLIRKPMPETEEECEKLMEKNPDEFFLKTITSKSESLKIMAVLQILSRHTREEVYLGQRENNWTSDQVILLEKFDKFRKKLIKIEHDVNTRNGKDTFKNRRGEVNVPYTLLYPNTSGDPNENVGLKGKGIPNSVSI